MPPKRDPDAPRVDLQHLLDSLPVMINVVTQDLKYAFVNKPFELLHGRTRDENTGKAVVEMIGEAGFEGLREHIEKALAGERVRFEVGLPDPVTGDVNTFRTTYVPRLSEDGAQDGFYSYSQNVTAQRRAETAKRQLEEQVNTLQRLESLAALAGGVAHDFNNLLVAVLSNAQLARESLGDGHPSAGELSEIELAARRASDLSKQMLAYSGKGRFRDEVVDLSDLAGGMEGLLRAALGAETRLEMELEQDLPPTTADSSQLRQIVLNLLTNAAEATGEEGRVILRTGRLDASREDLAACYVDDGLEPGEYVTFEVEDNGGGMDEATLGRIFDPFFSTKFPGRGLGLAACLGIVRAHEGAISVDSEVGSGTRIRVLLPVKQETPERRPLGREAERPRRRSAKEDGAGRVLVVDDEESVRRAASRILDRYGYEVVLADHGRAALEILQKDPIPFSAILLDLTMPVMGGVETLVRLREIGCDVPVVICSGYSEDHVRGRFDPIDVQAVVEKPFSIDALLDAMKSVSD